MQLLVGDSKNKCCIFKGKGSFQKPMESLPPMTQFDAYLIYSIDSQKILKNINKLDLKKILELAEIAPSASLIKGYSKASQTVLEGPTPDPIVKPLGIKADNGVHLPCFDSLKRFILVEE